MFLGSASPWKGVEAAGLVFPEACSSLLAAVYLGDPSQVTGGAHFPREL